MGCARTDVQPLSQNTFAISTSAAPACGASGARRVANQVAAIEVIKRGADRFIFVQDNSGSQVEGLTFNQFTGVGVLSSNQQYLAVRTLKQGEPGYSNGLSARQILGPNWQEIAASGTPATCVET
ncbi:MAG TPA: hypothetical protein DEO85_06550 [Maritimibacter sp.]|nr:hypothetical protein [Maritimibacter sp.]